MGPHPHAPDPDRPTVRQLAREGDGTAPAGPRYPSLLDTRSLTGEHPCTSWKSETLNSSNQSPNNPPNSPSPMPPSSPSSAPPPPSPCPPPPLGRRRALITHQPPPAEDAGTRE